MNTLTKQTVYLPVKIDDEFWTNWDNGEKPDYDLSNVDTGESIESWVNEKEGYFFTPEQLNEYTANVIRQALETAADNAKVVEEELGSDEYREIPIDTFESSEFIADKGYEERSFYRYKVSKQSITNTFEETFKNFKV